MMTDIGGWHLWVNHKDKVRMFTVAQPDPENAEAMVLDRIKGATTLDYVEASATVLQALGMEPNQIQEWGSPRTVTS